jgi:hypothetical protein
MVGRSLLRRSGRVVALAMLLASIGASNAGAATQAEAESARYRVRHGGKVALDHFESERTFETFDSRAAKRLESNLAWVDRRKPTDGGQVDIAFAGARRLLLITRTLDGTWFCTVTDGSGRQTLGKARSFRWVDTKRECVRS